MAMPGAKKNRHRMPVMLLLSLLLFSLKLEPDPHLQAGDDCPLPPP